MASALDQLLSVLQLPLVKPDMRDVFYAILRQCDDQELFARDVLDECNQAVYKEYITMCPCGCGSVVRMKFANIVLHDGEALNEVAREWMMDFLLISIGKRKNMNAKLLWYGHWCSETSYGLEGPFNWRAAEWQSTLYMRERTMDNLPPCCALTGAQTGLTTVRLLPESQDRDRIARFHKRANIFFAGSMDRYFDHKQETSASNTVVLCQFWSDMVDEGQLTFMSPSTGLIVAVGLTWEAETHLRSLYHYDFDLGGVPLLWNVPHGGHTLDSELIFAHWRISKTWQDTGLAERLIQDIRSIDSMPQKSQEIHALGPQRFKTVLHHKLSII